MQHITSKEKIVALIKPCKYDNDIERRIGDERCRTPYSDICISQILLSSIYLCGH